MRQIAVFTEKDRYFPGDLVSGHVLISTTKEFTCNRVVLKVRGKEYTHYQAGKVHVTDTHKFLTKDLILCEGGIMYTGDMKFEFAFELPKNAPPAHVGFRGNISYTIEAVAEINRARDPKSKININVRTTPPEYIPELPPASGPKRQEKEQLLVEIPTDILRPKKAFQVRTLVKERPRVKGVRIEIHRREDVICQSTHLDSKILICDKHIQIASSDFEQWKEETLHFDWGALIPFAAKLIRTSLILKVVMEVGLSIDPFVEFPLKVSGEKISDESSDDSIEMDLGW